MKRWQLKLPGTVANRTRTAILLLVLGAAIVSIIIGRRTPQEIHRPAAIR